MNQLLKDYFVFSRSEKNGILILLGIILMLSMSMIVLDDTEDESQVDFSNFENELAAFEQQLHVESPLKIESTPIQIQPFNPNQYPASEWKRLGMPAVLVHRIKKYESKGGYFDHKEDLKKIYGLNDDLYERLAPFLNLPDHERSFKSTKVDETINKDEVWTINVNRSSANDWKNLSGIGTVYANRIIKYKELLGGFCALEQVKEVYGIDDSLYNSLRSFLKLDTVELNQININTADAKKMMRHPYINDWNLVNAIINYRTNHGNFQEVGDLKEIHIVEHQWFEKVQPYLNVK